MCKEELVRVISDRTGEKRTVVKAVLDAFQDAVAESLAKGEQVSLYGFGVFEIKSRSPRIGRNPHNGQAVEIPARVLPSFTPSDTLKSRISGKKSENKSVSKSPRISPAK